MRIDGAIFAIEPRSVGGCIDLAVVFLREHFVRMMIFVGCFAVPSAALTWWLVDRCDWTTPWCLGLFAIECPFFGAALAVAAGRRAFGDTFSPWQGVKQVLKRIHVFLPLMLLIRFLTFIVSFFFVFPAYLVATRYGFVAEVLFLEGCSLRKHGKRITDLQSNNFGSLLGRLIAIITFFVISVLALFVLVDLGSGTLFGFPILSGRFSGLEFFQYEVSDFLLYDPRVATVLVGICWLVYAVTRLAWMFCYLDTRIRKEGWDIELDARVEGRRLEAAA